MPTVPQYGQLKVKTDALPGVRKVSSASTPQSEGAGIGQAQAQLGDTLARLGAVGVAEIRQAEKQRADEIGKLKLLDAFNQLDQKLLYDQQDGFLTKQGEQPHALTEKYVGEWDTQAGAIGALAKSPEQAAYYEQLRVTRGDSFRNRVDQHATSEYDKFERQQFDTTMEGSINAAIAAGADDPTMVSSQLIAQDDAIKTHAARLGMSPQAAQLLRDKSHAAVHAGIVEQLLDDPMKIGQAQAYYDKTKDQIAAGDPNAAARIEKALNEGATLAQAQKESDRILAAFSNITDARNAAKVIHDPKVRQQALELVEHDFAIKDKVKADQHDALILSGLNVAEQANSWTAIPRSQWLQYTVGERASIKEYLRAKAEGGVKTDHNVWAGLMNAAYSDDPKERDVFMNADPADLVGLLSSSDFEQVMRMRKEMRNGEHKVLVDEQFQQNVVDDAIVSMGLPTKPIEPGKDKYDAITYERVGAFRSAVRSAITRLEADPKRNGKKATDEEVQSIVDQLRTRVAGQQRVTKGGAMWNTYGQAYAFEVPQAQVSTVGDIPATERRRIEAALRAEGKQVSDAGVLAIFNLKLQQTRKDR